MRPAGCLTVLALAIATPALAQHHPHHPMPAPPAPEPAETSDSAPASTPEGAPEDDAMPAMDWPTELPPGDASTGGMEGMDHSAHGDVDEDVGSAPPPPAPTDHPADAIFGAAAMRPSRDQLRVEHGGSSTWMVLIDQAEWRARDGEDGFAWAGEAWFGGDDNRLVVKSEGEGSDGHLEEAEVQLLYSRAISPYFDLQAGLRQDLQDGPKRTYVTIGVEGLAPYWFETEGALFVSDEGEAFARLEGSYDLRLTQRLILQPGVEVNLSARDIPELELGSGVTDLELALRLRYQVTREFSPYVGVTFGRKFGGTADYAKAAGEDDTETSIVIGVRTWF